jgi:hypothetical protein
MQPAAAVKTGIHYQRFFIDIAAQNLIKSNPEAWIVHIAYMYVAHLPPERLSVKNSILFVQRL